MEFKNVMIIETEIALRSFEPRKYKIVNFLKRLLSSAKHNKNVGVVIFTTKIYIHKKINV